MDEKKVIILGGGISGLVSGIFAQMKGYNSKIYEKNSEVGGLFLNSNVKYMYYSDELKEIYDSIGLENIFTNEIEFLIQYKDIKLFKDEKKLEEELIKKSVFDEKRIKKFIEILVNAKEMTLFYEKPYDALSFIEPIKYKSKMKINDKIYKKYHSISIEKYFADFESKDIINLMYSIFPKKTSMYKLIFVLAMFISNRLLRLDVDSSVIIDKLKNKYLELGGKIETNKNAISIDVQKGKAMGVWFEKNHYVNADYVISAIDIKYLFSNLLKNKYQDRILDIKFKDFNSYPTYSVLNFEFLIKESDKLPIAFSDDISRIKIGSANVDKLAFSNKGNGLISCSIHQNSEEYVYWTLFNKDPNAYKKEINRIFELVKNELERILKERFNIISNARMIKYMTPLDYEAKFNCYRGSVFGFGLNDSGVLISHNGRIKEVQNIYLSSQWLSEYSAVLGAITNAYYSIIRLEYDKKRAYQ